MSSISAGTTSTTGLVATSDTTGTLVLQTGSTPTTALTIDTSQNIGVGVTPSTWASGWKTLQIGAGANFIGRTGVVNQLQLVANGYFNGTNYIYQNTGEATQYYQTGGQHVWAYSASGTAGNAITFTQAMSLDINGNLLVGKTTNNTGAKLSSSAGIGTENTATGRFSTVEYGSGANGTFTTITVVMTVTGSPPTCLLEIQMCGYGNTYLDWLYGSYGLSSSYSEVMRNNASSGTTVAVTFGASTLTATITTSVTHPVVKIKATSGGLAAGLTTLPTIAFA